MPFDFVPASVHRQFLPGRTTLQLNNAEGTVISVESGSLWVTMQNDSRDVVLTPGMRFEIDRGGRTLVTAEEDARFGLRAPDECPKGVIAWLACRFSSLLDQGAQEAQEAPSVPRRRWVPHY